LSVRDDDGTLWSILVGTYLLRKRLLEGEVAEWNDETREFETVDILGPVRPGELLAIELRGERQFTNQEGRLVTSPDYRTMRKQPAVTADGQQRLGEPDATTPEPEPSAASKTEDDIPF
jgi:hypothetical protein